MNTQKHKLLTVLIIDLVFSLACKSVVNLTTMPTSSAISTNSIQSSSHPPTANSPQDVEQYHKVGDVISTGDYSLAILGWKIIPEVEKKIIAVDLVIVSQSGSGIWGSTQISLKDSAGNKYDAERDGRAVNGNLVVGEKVRGTVEFKIPESAQDLKFIFNTNSNISKSEEVLVSLGIEPISVEPPSKLPVK